MQTAVVAVPAEDDVDQLIAVGRFHLSGLVGRAGQQNQDRAQNADEADIVVCSRRLSIQ